MELSQYARFVFALGFVLGMIWLCAYLARRTGFDKKLRGVSGQHGRLAVVDVLYLDPKRKLTLVRADAREYLLLITGDGATVIDKLDKADAGTIAQ
jgi:flagellar protein FliO/FliZ